MEQFHPNGKTQQQHEIGNIYHSKCNFLQALIISHFFFLNTKVSKINCHPVSYTSVTVCDEVSPGP